MPPRPSDPRAPDHLDDHLDAVLLGGREPGFVTLVEYDPAWPDRFLVERARVIAAIGPVARRVEHIGSTAVPGLAAKPIVDMLVEVEDPGDEERYLSALEQAGFVLRVREPRHRMFQTPAKDVHVHLWPAGSAETTDYLTLRDWLRGHDDDLRLYERVKRGLAERSWPDANYYAEAKSPVIGEILARAKRRAGPEGHV